MIWSGVERKPDVASSRSANVRSGGGAAASNARSAGSEELVSEFDDWAGESSRRPCFRRLRSRCRRFWNQIWTWRGVTPRSVARRVRISIVGNFSKAKTCSRMKSAGRETIQRGDLSFCTIFGCFRAKEPGCFLLGENCDAAGARVAVSERHGGGGRAGELL